jgi:hypothetical protein
MSDIDWPNVTDNELRLLASYGNTPEIVAAAKAEQARRKAQQEPPNLTYTEFALLRAVVEGTFRRRRGAPPLGESPQVQGLVRAGFARLDGNRLLVTEDGLGAMEAYAYDLSRNRRA